MDAHVQMQMEIHELAFTYMELTSSKTSSWRMARSGCDLMRFDALDTHDLSMNYRVGLGPKTVQVATSKVATRVSMYNAWPDYAP